MSCEHKGQGTEYTCERCGGTFVNQPDWGHTDRIAESEIVFGELKPEERASVCSECWQYIMEWMKTNGLL